MGKVGNELVLSSRVYDYLKNNKSEDETVLFCIVGEHDQSLIALNKRLLIIKPGFMANASFGAKVASFFYKDITGIEVNVGLAVGVIEILTPSYEGTRERSWIGANLGQTNNVFVVSNCIPISKKDLNMFKPYIDKLRKLVEDAKHPQTETANKGNDIASQLESIAKLYKEGILTEEEYLKAKKKILGD